MIELLFTMNAAIAEPRPADFLPAAQLDRDLKAYCLKTAVKNTPPELHVIEATDKYVAGVHLQSIRFVQNFKSINGPPGCGAEREIVQIVDGGKKILFDSGLHERPYCESPVQFTYAPRVFELAQLSADPDIAKKRRKLAVLETFSSTLPCPDVDDVRSRRFRLYDLGGENALMLDVEADSILPEIGDENPYRLHVVDARRVLKSMTKMENGTKPVSIELEDGRFALHLEPTKAPKLAAAPPASPTVALNSVYRKDATSVYYQLVDEGGRIEGADPNTFQLLSDDGESAYAKDAKSVYYYGKRVAKADPKTFVQLNDRYGKDINRVYHQQREMPNVDLASFTAPYKHSAWHARDKDHVYSSGEILIPADPETFDIGEDRSCGGDCRYRSEDKNYRFDWSGKIVQKLAAP